MRRLVYADVDIEFGDSTNMTNRLWRRENAEVASVTVGGGET